MRPETEDKITDMAADVLVFAFSSFLVMILWNLICAKFLLPKIDYLQAVILQILSNLLLKDGMKRSNKND